MVGTMEIPAKYKKATAPLNETARDRLWATAPSLDGEEMTSELSDLVDSFYEGKGDESDGWASGSGSGRGDNGDMLDAVLADSGSDLVAEWIRVAIEDALRVVGSGADEVKKRVVGRLRERGYDSGLCRSEWDQTGCSLAGHHEYVDVIAEDGTRYVVEINLSGEFDIARPSDKYSDLLNSIPNVFVGKPDVLKKLIHAMCVAAKESMKSAGMHIPPWRTREYMQHKWFSSYSRTTNFRSALAASNIAERSREISSRRKFCRVEVSPRWPRNGKVSY